MTTLFYLASAVAVLSTLMVITRTNAVHALLYLVISLLSVALIFFMLGAPFVAALEVIVYAGAIMVLFVFVVMLLNVGPQSAETESRLFRPRMLVGPVILAAILLTELIVALGPVAEPAAVQKVSPQAVGVALFGTYLLGVELAGFLLLAGLVGAFHLGYRARGAGEEDSR